MLVISILTIVVALSISAVAAFYSIIGLTAIFPASFLAVIIMGTVLELGKITTAIWLHTFWHECKWWLKTYLASALIVLMFITSLGIFGFLSRAHIEHSSGTVGNEFVIQSIDQRIERQNRTISDAENVISQLDQAVNTLADAQRIRGVDGAIATRERQTEERNQLNGIISDAFIEIQNLTQERTELQIEQAKIEAEVGPIRYVAELIYGDNPDRQTLEAAVRYLIIIIVLVFDPLAVCLILAAITGLHIRKKNNKPVIKEDVNIIDEPQDISINTNTNINSFDIPDINKPKPTNTTGWLGNK